ncbi:MAG: hypothetical protein M1819_001082 [Sarea resinae]|nr:MAG: hypothetical protein M1819_001082 [Sarea resinae]
MAPIGSSLAIPKSDLEVLSQYIDDETGRYRLRAGRRVHYLTISIDVFDDDTMCRPYLLIPQLPDIPDGAWTKMEVYRHADGSLRSSISSEPLAAVEMLWHPRIVDVLSLKQTKRHRSGVHEVLFDSNRPAVAKIACFDFQLPQIEDETHVYSIISQHQEAAVPPVAPAFLAHLAENGRVMGMLLEKLEGDYATIDDLPACEEAVRRVHRMGMIHGDVNRYNFIVDRSKKCARLVDFEHASPYNETEALAELQSLPAELVEATGRGGTIIWKEPQTGT